MMEPQIVALNAHPIARKRRLEASGRGEIGIEDVTVTFGRGGAAQQAVSQTSLSIAPGEFICILGPSGCGKSTLLNAVAGYVEPTTGSIRVDGEPVKGPGPDRGMVFQQYGDESLKRSEHGTVQQYRRMLLPVLSDIGRTESCRQIQVDLVRAALPVAANGVAQHEL